MIVGKTSKDKPIEIPLNKISIATFSLRELVELYGVCLYLYESKSRKVTFQIRKDISDLTRDIIGHIGDDELLQVIQIHGFSDLVSLKLFAREIVFEEFR